VGFGKSLFYYFFLVSGNWEKIVSDELKASGALVMSNADVIL